MDFFILLSIWRWISPLLWSMVDFALGLFTWNRVFWFAVFYRYLRLVVNCYAHWTYKSKPLPEKQIDDSGDVTVIIPTIHNNFEELRPFLQSILATNPAKLMLVTTTNKHEALQNFTQTLDPPTAEVYHVRIANKRLQVCEVIPLVQTKYMVLADDDVLWPKTIIPWMLAPFTDPRMGAVGPSQRVIRLTAGSVMARIWNFLGAAYLERRNFEISATHKLDGGTSCMSGRTCFFRTEILQDPLFLDGFKNERWGQYQLNADDDNFITRWIANHQWKTWIQYEPECEIETTLENNSNFLRQCVRWARSNWRSNWTSLTESLVWQQQWWCLYAVHLQTFTSLALAMDPFLVYACSRAADTWGPTGQKFGLSLFLSFMLFSKVVKLRALFGRDATDILFLPACLLFGWFHGLIKLHALMTLRETSWGSRADGDLDDKARMSPRRRAESIANPSPGQKGLIRYADERTYAVHRIAKSEKSVLGAGSAPADDGKSN